MKKIACVGHSIATVQLIKELETRREDFSLTVISTERDLPYERAALPAVLSPKANMKNFSYQNASFYQSHNVPVITETPLTRINTQRRRLYFADRSQLDFDVLLLADLSGHRFEDIKGSNKTGLYDLLQWSQVLEFRQQIPLADTVMIQSDDPWGLSLALEIAALQCEVILVQTGTGCLSVLPEDTVRSPFCRILEKSGVRVVCGEQIIEILGDSHVKAVRLTSGKVFGCNLVATDRVRPDMRLFSGDDLELGERILINNHHQTNLSQIYAVDWIAEPEITSRSFQSRYQTAFLQEQGRLLASELTGQSFVASLPHQWHDLSTPSGLQICMWGDLRLASETRLYVKSEPEAKRMKAYFLRQGRLSGILLLNAPEVREEVKGLTEAASPLEPAAHIFQDCDGYAAADLLQVQG